MVTVTSIKRGQLKKIDNPTYKYATCGKYRCYFTENDKEYCIKIPEGFLTDGSTKSPDVGVSWLFHDYLYATHFYQDVECERQKADDIMYAITQEESRETGSSFIEWYGWIARRMAQLNPFYTFSRAWESSGKRGPEYFNNH